MAFCSLKSFIVYCSFFVSTPQLQLQETFVISTTYVYVEIVLLVVSLISSLPVLFILSYAWNL